MSEQSDTDDASPAAPEDEAPPGDHEEPEPVRGPAEDGDAPTEEPGSDEPAPTDEEAPAAWSSDSATGTDPDLGSDVDDAKIDEEHAEVGFEKLDVDGSGYLSKGEVKDAVSQFYFSSDPDARGNWLMGPLDE
jgi:hypothetical protein